MSGCAVTIILIWSTWGRCETKQKVVQGGKLSFVQPLCVYDYPCTIILLLAITCQLSHRHFQLEDSFHICELPSIQYTVHYFLCMNIYLLIPCKLCQKDIQRELNEST